jgi:hypothetical protein
VIGLRLKEASWREWRRGPVLGLLGLFAALAPPAGAQPLADFIWSPNPAIVGQPVQFTDTSIGVPTSWEWRFGDLTTSTAQNPTKTYATPGMFDVNLIATNAQGSSKRREQTITVLPAQSSVTKILPIVLDVVGTGARFGTEITLANRGTTAATLTMTYTAAGQLGGAGSGTVTETLGSLKQMVIPDGIAYLRSKGLPIPAAGNQGGTLRIVFAGVSSPDVAYAGARTTAPAGTGRAGFGYAAVRPEDGLTGRSFLFGLRENASDRSNLAFVNLSPTSSVTLRVTLVSGAGDGQTFVLPDDVFLGPLQWAQIGRVLNNASFTSGYASIDIVDGAGPYFVYGVFNDNATNDGSYVLPVPGSPASELQLLPVLVETGTFQSELVLTNPLSDPVTVIMTYVESLTPSAGAGGVAAESLKPFEQKIIPNALEYLRSKGVAVGPPGRDYAGSMGVVFTQAGVTSYGFAGARTAAPGDRGQYGFFGRAAGLSESAAAEVWVFALQQNSLNRSAVAVCNVGDAGTGVTLRAELYDGDTGQLVFTLDGISVAPGGWLQYSSALAPLGVKNGFVRFIRVSGDDHIVAYGVVNDGATPSSGATNDGSYIPFANK